MQFADQHPGYRIIVGSALLCALAITGCSSKPKAAPAKPPRYATLPPKQVPDFLKDTILERTDLLEIEPKLISGFGVVAKLHHTGDNTLVPQTVRNYIIREMVKRGFGSKLNPDYADLQPELMLRSDSVAIVRVDGYIPPGARKGERFDVQVSALPGTNTTSVAHGSLYRTDLKVDGAQVQYPGYAVEVAGCSEGQIFVNPAYVLEGNAPQSDQAKASLRYGIIMDGGVAMSVRPLVLRVRSPQRSLARAIELLIEQRFASLKRYQMDKIASAKDEAIIVVQVPDQYRGDWEHFAGVMTHLYLETRPGMIAQHAKQLAELALEPDAKLMDISYCWEAIGTPALDYIEPLLVNEKPDVAFAAARAAAYIGSAPAAIAALVRIATTRDHPFQINAIQVLGDLPNSPLVAAELRKLLDSQQTLVRLEAYRVLAAHADPVIFSTPVGHTAQGPKFKLDIVPSTGPPIIYASRRGPPRIAIIGAKPFINMPAMFTAMDSALSISSTERSRSVTIYYRGVDVVKPIRLESNPDIAEIAARLGGVAARGEPALNFNYGDVVAMLQALSDARQVSSVLNGQRVPVAFVMQEAPNLQQDIQSAPVIPDQGRPESNGPVGMDVSGQEPAARSQ